MLNLSATLEACIEECLRCQSVCLAMATQHCLVVGGRHLEPDHYRLMLACAEMCRTSAQMMLIGTPYQRHTCRVCASICDECATSCAAIGGMDDCVIACRACAVSCRHVAG